MGAPFADITFGIPTAAVDGRLYSAFPMGDAPNAAGAAQGLGSEAVSSAAAGSAAGGGLSAPGTTTIEEGVAFTIETLSGEDFGVGPVTVLFDTLSGGTNGATVQTTNPEVGAYNQTGNAYFSNMASRSGGTAVQVYAPDTFGIRSLRTSWTAAQAVAVRYWVWWPEDGALPGGVPGALSANGSNYKLAWLGVTSNMTGGTDVCLPTFSGTTECGLSGNGNTASAGDGCCWNRYPTGSSATGGLIAGHFVLGKWVMVEVLEDATTPRVRVMHCNETLGVKRYTKSDASNYWGNSTIQYWSHCNLPGYIRDPSLNNPSQTPHPQATHVSGLTYVWADTNILHADYCIKTGAGAWADVFFGNAADIDDCTDLRHARIVSWTSDAIIAIPRGTSGINFSGWYLHIRLADDTYLPSRLIG